jgi:hypothetical protein
MANKCKATTKIVIMNLKSSILEFRFCVFTNNEVPDFCVIIFITMILMTSQTKKQELAKAKFLF